MTITKISDGLGNQLFQYALGRSISYKKGTILKLDTSAFDRNYKFRNYQLDKYNIVKNDFTFIENFVYSNFYRIIKKIITKFNLKNKFYKNIYWEKKEFDFDSNVFKVNSNYFFGYWQDFRYFKDIRTILLDEFKLLEHLNSNNSQVMQEIKSTQSISLHVRRGDYLNITHQQVCDLEYYKKAIDLITTEIKNPHFFIFSDDIEWVKENLQINYDKTFVDFNQNNPEYDLELMKSCKHNIIANSTFSWWGAWLNNNESKIVISPKYWQSGFLTPTGLIDTNWKLL